MELRQIRDFVTVVKAGSFAAASRLLNVSQPGLGYQIKQLELDLGTELLIRHSRGVELTVAGAVFLGDAERILLAIGEARNKVRDAIHAAETNVRIGLSPTPQQLLGPSLSELGTDDPRVRVSFRDGLSAKLIQDVRSGLLDVAICILTQKLFDLRTVPLYREHLHLIGPAIAGEDKEIRLADLAGIRLTTGPKDHLPRRLLDEEAARQGIALEIAQELEPGGLRRALVLHGNTYTVASCAMFVDEVEAGLLAARRIVDPALGLEVQMVCSPALSPAVEAMVLARVREAIAAHPTAAEPIDPAAAI
jgi:LysR family nitrogen assimilation transcriptional regulator